MKTLVSPTPRTKISRTTARGTRSCSVVCLTSVGLLLAITSINAALKIAPFVSYVPDQAITNSAAGFKTQYFRILDLQRPPNNNGFTVMWDSSNSTFYNKNNIMVEPCTTQDAGCADDGTGYKVEFMANPAIDDATTITIKAKENGSGGLIGYASFSLRLDSTAINPPVLGNLPGWAVAKNSVTGIATYETKFIIGDVDESGNEDINGIDPDLDFTVKSSNPNVLNEVTGDISVTLVEPSGPYSIEEGPRTYLLSINTDPTGITGETTITVELTDPADPQSGLRRKTSTSFILQVVAATNAPPTISNAVNDTFEEQTLPTVYTDHAFTVTNDSNLDETTVTAFSSNSVLVPNDFVNNLVVTQPDSTGAGSVKITPLQSLPAPGIPQASTITLSVVDNAFVRQTTFLFILSPEGGGVAKAFTRPSGLYLLNPKSQDAVHRDDDFLTGELLGISWAAIEYDENMFDWSGGGSYGDGDINNVIDAISGLQTVAINLQEEPCYIASTEHDGDRDFDTWCDTNQPNTDQQVACPLNDCVSNGKSGTARAVPYDGYLRDRRTNFLVQLAAHLGAARLARVVIMNPNLPGMDTGLRNVSFPIGMMPGYTRELLLGAAEEELQMVQDNFPGKLLHIGFWKLGDGNDNPELWQWLYRDATTDPNALDEDEVRPVALADEFNGIKRPRVSFFQENLAAARISIPDASPAPVSASNAPNYIAPKLTTAYTFSPDPSFMPSFGYYTEPTEEQYNNGIALSSNVPWTMPFRADVVRLTLNGSPNDALEAVFNSYSCQYLELYPDDVDRAQPDDVNEDPDLNAILWAGELQSWHDYFFTRNDAAPIEPPAGLTVVRTGSGTTVSNLISWDAVYGATTYNVQIIDFSAASPTWVDALPCDPNTPTQCMDTTQDGTMYGFRVRAAGTDAWAYVAVFLSEDLNDGYISFDGSNYQRKANATQPGIRAGRGSTMSTELKGFLSFDTSKLDGATVLGAKLRLNQTTDNSGYDALGPCMVDIKKGYFGNSVLLENVDFSTAASTQDDAARVRPSQTPPDWVEAELIPLSSYLDGINTDPTYQMGRTQFRLHFGTVTTMNKQVKWNSGETAGSTPSTPPQLLVRFTP